jgi:hypothetical protein
MSMEEMVQICTQMHTYIHATFSLSIFWLLHLLSDPEDGVNMYLGKVRKLLPHYRCNIPEDSTQLLCQSHTHLEIYGKTAPEISRPGIK